MAPRVNGSQNVFNFTPPENLEYCLTPQHQSIGPWKNYRCLYWDENFVLYPLVEDHDMFITTRVTITEQSLPNCTLEQFNCTYNVDHEEDFYIADIDRFTILLDHTVYAQGILQANGVDLPGFLLDSGGNPFNNLTKLPNQVGKSGKADILELSTLLGAGGLWSLDTQAETRPDRSKRDDGVVFIVFIEYSNMVNYNLSNLQYTYRVEMIHSTKFKAEQPIFTKNVATRVLWNRHGVRFIFLQVGAIGKFDFQTILLTLVSGLGLMTFATVIVDILATKILPRKTLYGSYKYDETEPFMNSINEEKNKTSENISSKTRLLA